MCGETRRRDAATDQSMYSARETGIRTRLLNNNYCGGIQVTGVNVFQVYAGNFIKNNKINIYAQFCFILCRIKIEL